jgi:hypothetical protein
MTRQILIVIGAALLSLGSIGLIVGLAWLAAVKILGTLPHIFEPRFETLLYMLPALLLFVALAGASFIARALADRHKASRPDRIFHFHTRFHA